MTESRASSPLLQFCASDIGFVAQRCKRLVIEGIIRRVELDLHLHRGDFSLLSMTVEHRLMHIDNALALLLSTTPVAFPADHDLVMSHLFFLSVSEDEAESVHDLMEVKRFVSDEESEFGKCILFITIALAV